MKTTLFNALLIPALLLCACTKKNADDETPLPTSGYSVVDVSNAGSLSGHVKLVGQHPTAALIETQRDQDVCGASHPNPAALGAGDGVNACVVFIEHISSGKAFAKGKWEIDQKGCEFLPHVLAVPFGATVTVSNSDAALHNFHITKGSETILNEAQPEGSPAREAVMKKSGVLAVSCDVHPWMRSYVFVAENPYYAITDASGAYSIDAIPPGDYSISLWRDNWNVEMVKDAEGRVQSYRRGPDLVKKQQVHVEAGKPVTLDFTLP